MIFKENTWYLVNENGDNHRWMNLPKEQMERVHFNSRMGGPQYFIILPPLPGV